MSNQEGTASCRSCRLTSSASPPPRHGFPLFHVLTPPLSQGLAGLCAPCLCCLGADPLASVVRLAQAAVSPAAPADPPLPTGSMWPAWVFPGLPGTEPTVKLSLELEGTIRCSPVSLPSSTECRSWAPLPAGSAPDTGNIQERKTILTLKESQLHWWEGDPERKKKTNRSKLQWGPGSPCAVQPGVACPCSRGLANPMPCLPTLWNTSQGLSKPQCSHL